MPVAVVTGASSGIGYSVTNELTNRGYVVYACARRVERIEPLVSKHGTDKVKPIKLDISQYDEVKQFKKFLETELVDGKLDLLYNNAGQSCSLSALDVTNDIMQRCFAVNVFGHVNMTRELSKMIINAKGNIVFTGSVTGLVSVPFVTIYSATKAAIHQYARGLHLEMKPFGVRVINVITGGVSTDINKIKQFPDETVVHFKEEIKTFQANNELIPMMSSDVYAKQVVNVITSSSDPVDIYKGHFAGVLRAVGLFVPMWLLQWVLYRGFNLNKAETVIREETAKKAR